MHAFHLQINFCDLRPTPADAEPVTRNQLNVILTHITNGDAIDSIRLKKELLDRSTLLEMTILLNFRPQQAPRSGTALSEVHQENLLKAVRSASLGNYVKVSLHTFMC